MADLYLDHNVSRRIAGLLRDYGHTVATARDLGLDYAGDDEHLLTAAARGWILISHNHGDFELPHDAWRRWTAEWRVADQHAGILLVPQPPHVSPEQAAEIVNDLLSTLSSLVNALYIWRQSRGWQRRM